MSHFIEIADYEASIHQEILASLLRERLANGQSNPKYDPTIIEVCEERAIQEMWGYLSGHYDCERIFSARGSERNHLILMYALDITIYHIFTIHNPYKIADIRKERYDRAIEWLKEVARRKITISNAPRLPEEEQAENSPFQIHADQVRPVLI